MPWVLHMTWQITLGSLHLIIHFDAHLNEEVQEMGHSFTLALKYFKSYRSYFLIIILIFYQMWVFPFWKLVVSRINCYQVELLLAVLTITSPVSLFCLSPAGAIISREKKKKSTHCSFPKGIMKVFLILIWILTLKKIHQNYFWLW